MVSKTAMPKAISIAARLTKSTKPAEPAAAKNSPERVFDARPDRLDFRDLPYRPPLRSLPPLFPLEADFARLFASFVEAGLILDQGRQGACTGFGLASVANYLLWTRHIESKTRLTFLPVSQRMLFELAKRYDEWPGVDYDYSSPRGALKGWHKHGVCSDSNWHWQLDKDGNAVYQRPMDPWAADAAQRPLGVYYRVDRDSVVDLQSAIVNIGAIYASANAHDGWDAMLDIHQRKAALRKHADLPVIPPLKDPTSLGGHAFALVGFNERGFIVQNSWGRRWGAGGFAVLPYEDWVAHATDAWACALGVPVVLNDALGQARVLTASRWRLPSGRGLNDLQRQVASRGNPPEDPWPIDHPFDHAAYQPWRTGDAYAHTLVTGNDGELVPTDFTRAADDADGLTAEIVHQRPLQWMKAQGLKTLKIAVYAHGGLNSEDASIRRIRVLAPYFVDNGIYPLFLTWKTGIGETLFDLAADWAHKLFGDEPPTARGLFPRDSEARDRAVEALAHVLGKGVWSEMRENADRATLEGHGLALLQRHLQALAAEVAAAGGATELHLIGHSAGALLLGHLLTLMAGTDALRVSSTHLFAPACSARFALDTYAAAAGRGVLDLQQLRLHVLSDANEKADGLPSPDKPAYGKSLLYLVSRALDDVRKMPLLGMERTLAAAYADSSDQWDAEQLAAVKAWQKLWPGKASALLDIVNQPKVRITRTGDQTAATHGSFDNNIEVMTATLGAIAGRALVAPMEWLDY